ncbi:MAG TPA: FAD-linked oxidase C-terminal domain-containing protein [Solirubrobacteraceae bacterium]|nr:FAD-linked oxidase C-terminal domain-containing protein [Solirubrobacteraceae bacterium]
MRASAASELRRLLGERAFVRGSLSRYASDATEHEGLRRSPDLVVVPGSTEEVRLVVEWAYRREVPLVPRGGGTGFSGGAVPVNGGVVVDLSRLNGVRSLDPGFWRMHVEAGTTTATVRRLARENGLYFPPDPGAAEQSQIGGNIATNAGGPHAFKYGVTGDWVMGLEAVIPPGEVISVGGAIRKDVAGYDLKSLLVGSEGTLGIITAAWLRLLPSPESALPLVAAYPGTAEGCAAIEAVLASGVVPAAIEFLEGAALAAGREAFPINLPASRFLVICECDGSADEAARTRAELREALVPGCLQLWAPNRRQEFEALWRWRDGVSLAVASQRGGKVSEDIVVPVDRLREAIESTVRIGEDYGLEACSWGHAGDGNLHSTFLVDANRRSEVERAHAAARDLHALAVALGGSISGEHGIGWLKRGRLGVQWGDRALQLHQQIKRVFDPKNLINPGKKT